jgi:hypothetical protein
MMLIPVTAQDKRPGLSLKRAERNQTQLAGRRVNAARSILYPKRIDPADF